MSDAKRRSTSVFTKGQLHSILAGLVEEVRPLKSPKDIVRKLEETAKQYTPSARGRGKSYDLAALQAVVDEVAGKISGTDGKFLCGMVCAHWNVNHGTSRLMDSQTIQRLVLNNKLKFPEQFIINVVKRPRKVVIATETVEQTENAA